MLTWLIVACLLCCIIKTSELDRLSSMFEVARIKKIIKEYFVQMSTWLLLLNLKGCQTSSASVNKINNIADK